MLRMVDFKKDDTRNWLLYIQLFEGLTPTQLDWVAQRAHRRIFEAGRNVMTIEQPGEAVYIILHGTVKVHIEQGGTRCNSRHPGNGRYARRDESDRQRRSLRQRCDIGRQPDAVDGQGYIQLPAG